MSLQNFILAVNSFWHFLAFYYFTFYSGGILAKLFKERPISAQAIEVLKFLGAMNGAIVILGLAALFMGSSESRLIFLFFSMANLSQFIFDLRAHKNKIARPRLRIITFGDGLLFLVNLYLVF